MHKPDTQGRIGGTAEIESGSGSFTAEQFLLILKLFNVAATYFGPAHVLDESDLQNALARLGALHLQESEYVVPSERLEDVNKVVRETLVVGSPRLPTALGPVLARNADRINLRRLDATLAEVGMERRLAWLVENVLKGVQDEVANSAPVARAKRYRRAAVVLASFLDAVVARQLSRTAETDVFAPDILDGSIRSKQTLKEVKASSSSISQRWGIVTALQPEDFSLALRAARVGN